MVERSSDFRRITACLEDEKIIGVDLEADSMFHYQERVCLLQISTPTRNILIDPLALDDLSPLAPVFADPGIRKVFHGADYDIRSLHRDFGFRVNSLFDTQIAARFLGLRETGLASLLRDRFGLHMEKKYQKKDWSQRSLPKGMLDYAALDSSYLLALAHSLEEELKATGRLSWVDEECEIQSRVRPVHREAGPLFLKFRGAGRLDPRSLAVLEAILRLRESVAKRRDRPPFKVLGNAQIMDMALKKPVTMSGLKAKGGLSSKQVKPMGQSLIKAIKTGLSLSQSSLPSYPRKTSQRIGRKTAERVRALKAWRDQTAARLDMDPALICNNTLIRSLVLAHPGDPEDLEGIDGMRKWQRQAFGQEICSLF